MSSSISSYSVRSLLRQSSIYYLGNVIIMLSSIVSLPILTRILSKSEYGILSLVMLMIFLVQVPAKFGLQNSAFYYFDEFKLKKRPESMDTYYSTLFWGSLFVSILVAVIFLAGGEWLLKYLPNKKLVDFTKVVSALVVVEAMIIRIRNFLRVEQRSKLFVLIGIINSYGRIFTGLSYFYIISRTVQGFLIGTLITGSAVLVLSIVFLGWQNAIKLKSFSIKFFKECLVYGYPFIGIEASSLFMKYADRYLIDYFWGAGAVGVYSVSGNLCLAISNGIFSSIWLALTPMYMRIYREKGEDKTAEFVSKSINMLLFLIVPIVFGLSVTSYEVITILASEKYIDSAPIIPYLIAAAAIWGLTPLYATGFYIKKKTNLLNRIVLFSTLINIALKLFMIPRLGIKGAGMSALVAYSISFLLSSRSSYYYLKLKTDFMSIAHYILAGVVMYITLMKLEFSLSIIGLLTEVMLGLVIYLSIVLVLNSKIRIELKTALRTNSIIRKIL